MLKKNYQGVYHAGLLINKGKREEKKRGKRFSPYLKNSYYEKIYFFFMALFFLGDKNLL